MRRYIVPAAKRVGSDLFEFAAPEMAEVLSGRKKFRAAANCVRRQTLRKQLASWSRKGTASRVMPTKSAKPTSRSQKDSHKHFSLNMLSKVRYKLFVVVPRKTWRESPSSYRCLVVSRTRNFSIYLNGWKMHRVWISNDLEPRCWFDTDVLGCETRISQESWLENFTIPQENKEEHTESAETDEEAAAEEVQETSVPLISPVNNILHSVISNVEVYIKTQNSNGLYAHKSDISINFKVAISEYKGDLHCEGYDYQEIPDGTMEALLSELFSTRRMKMLSRPERFMLYGKLGDNFFSTSKLLYPNMRIRLRLIRATPNFYNTSDIPVSLGIVDCSLYTHRMALQYDYHKKRMDMPANAPVMFNYLENLAKTFIVPAIQI